VSAYRILVTGSRSWKDEAVIYAALDEVYQARRHTGPVTLVHGACPNGADTIAGDWYANALVADWVHNANSPLTEERHPADWSRYRKRAGFVRNAEMVTYGADVCLAFVDWCDDRRCPKRGQHGSHGAVGCAELAEKAGIQVKPFGIDRKRWTA
jgi:hypothetical protein